MRRLVKAAVLVILAGAAWRFGSGYLTHYRFREAVRQATLEHRAEEDLRQAILEEAGRLGIPLAEDGLDVEFEDRRTIVSGTYTRSIELVPGVERPWAFAWMVETFGPPEIRATP